MVPAVGRRTEGSQLGVAQWAVLGIVAAIISVIAVLSVRALALVVWPEVASFQPLDSVARAVLFTAVPAFIATGLLAWLAARREEPVGAFLRLAAIVLVLSFIPDYILPLANKAFLGSTVAAFLHVIAAITIAGVLIGGYRWLTNQR